MILVFKFLRENICKQKIFFFASRATLFSDKDLTLKSGCESTFMQIMLFFFLVKTQKLLGINNGFLCLLPRGCRIIIPFSWIVFEHAPARLPKIQKDPRRRRVFILIRGKLDLWNGRKKDMKTTQKTLENGIICIRPIKCFIMRGNFNVIISFFVI